ncbi:MAG: hypothetical protein IJK15_10315 [Bacteroidaceae bacterium]|nr:hypothetical protein [Bacteroidaceae bacterium]
MAREQLYENILLKQSFLCVGLNTNLKKVPQFLIERASKEEGFDPIFEFNRAIIYADSTERYAEVAGEKAREVQQQMADILRQHA